MEKRELPDIHEPKKPPMSEKKKQSILEKLWLTYYNDTLLEKGVIKHVYDGVKVLGNGEYTKKLTVKLHAFSASAKEKIEACGGTAEVI